MRQHVTILGVLFIALVFGGAAGIVSVAADDPEATAIAVPILGTVGTAIGLFILVMSIPDIIAGIGLLERRPWARILGIVLCVLGLLHFPFGTIVGVYGLWVLFSPETEALFRGMPPSSP